MDSVQCHPVGNRHIGALQQRCLGWARQGLDNLRAANYLRAEDYVCTGHNLRTANDVCAKTLCRTDAYLRSHDYLCSCDHLRAQNRALACDHLRAEDNMCAQKTSLPSSDSHTHDDLRSADHVRACPNLCSWARSEVRCRSEVIRLQY